MMPREKSRFLFPLSGVFLHMYISCYDVNKYKEVLFTLEVGKEDFIKEVQVWPKGLPPRTSLFYTCDPSIIIFNSAPLYSSKSSVLNIKLHGNFIYNLNP